MSDHPPADVDALLARIAGRTALLRAAVCDSSSADEERALVRDLAAVAAVLRASATEASTVLAAVLNTADPATRRAHGSERGGKRPRLDPLTRLAILRGTDKWGAHFYTPVYHELLRHLRELPIRLLEIGVGGYESRLTGGASLLMWADYFPYAHIVGIDAAEKTLPRHARVTILQGRQEDAAFVARVSAEHGPFDVVIDDGSHVPAHVRASFDALFPLLNDRGLYIVEDVQTAFWPRFGGSAPGGAATMALAREALDAVNHAEIGVAAADWPAPSFAPLIRSMRAFHNLLVFERGDNTAPSTGRFDGASPHVAAALDAMEDVLAATPTAAGFAQLARTCSQAQQPARAVAALARGLERWPDDVTLLVAGLKVARRSNDAALARHCAERLARVAADDPALQGVIRTATDGGR